MSSSTEPKDSVGGQDFPRQIKEKFALESPSCIEGEEKPFDHVAIVELWREFSMPVNADPKDSTRAIFMQDFSRLMRKVMAITNTPVSPEFDSLQNKIFAQSPSPALSVKEEEKREELKRFIAFVNWMYDAGWRPDDGVDYNPHKFLMWYQKGSRDESEHLCKLYDDWIWSQRKLPSPALPKDGRDEDQTFYSHHDLEGAKQLVQLHKQFAPIEQEKKADRDEDEYFFCQSDYDGGKKCLTICTDCLRESAPTSTDREEGDPRISDLREYTKWIREMIENELLDGNRDSLASRLAFELQAHVEAYAEGSEQWRSDFLNATSRVVELQSQIEHDRKQAKYGLELMADRCKELEAKLASH
jgi:hypothetical protein